MLKPDPLLPVILAAVPQAPKTRLRHELMSATGISDRKMARRLKILQLSGQVRMVGRIHWQATGVPLPEPVIERPPEYAFRSVLAPGAPWPYGAQP